MIEEMQKMLFVIWIVGIWTVLELSLKWLGLVGKDLEGLQVEISASIVVNLDIGM